VAWEEIALPMVYGVGGRGGEAKFNDIKNSWKDFTRELSAFSVLISLLLKLSARGCILYSAFNALL
jgi:hypothetical protein